MTLALTKTLRRRAATLLRSEEGPSAAEYAIMLALIVLVSMGAIGGIGGSVMNLYEAIRDSVAASGM